MRFAYRSRWRLSSLSTLAVFYGVTVAGAATFTVVNTSGSGAGSFEQAINNANASLDADDTIQFAIPGGGVPTIVDSLPAVTGPVLIDATTQAGGFVELQNGGGIALSITGSGSTVKGLVINSSATGVSLGPAAANNTITGCRIGTNPTGTAAVANQTGVFIQGGGLGGNNTIANNLISGNTSAGINIQGSNNVATGNVIGLDVSQTQALGGGTGVIINNGTNNRIGGTGAGEGNVIAGLSGTGISLQNATAAGNVIQGNWIGTNAANALGLGVSVGVAFGTVSGAGNVVGGATAGAGNVIVAASSNGVAMTNSSNATIQGNTIGTAALPNVSNGMDLAGSDNNTIADNVISGNGDAGINLRSGADGNTIRGNEISGNDLGIALSGQMDRFTENSIHDNDGLGIDLGVNGVTENDLDDVDVGPGTNDGQNFPVLSMVTAAEVTGTLNSTPDTEFTVEFFATPACDISGNGEGQTFLGAIQATTDGSGDADLVFALPPAAAGQVITATAIAPDGDTSEFSDCSGTVPGTTTTTTTSTAPTTTSTSSTTTTTQPTTTSTTSTTTTTTATATTTVPTTTTAPSTTSTTTSTTPTTSPTTSTSTTSTSTTSTSSSTSSSSTAPTTSTSSTTTTTLGDPCAVEPVGPTFRSLNCRLAALLEQVNAATDLGTIQPRLRSLLEGAKARKDEAEGFCREPDPRRTNKRLKQSDRKVVKIGQTLRSLRARKTLPDPLRTDLLAAADAIRGDLRALRQAVSCPDDAA
jgi:parallel beta-helix repeat protein